MIGQVRMMDRPPGGVFVSRNGSIQSPEGELQEIGEWHIETLLKLNEVFTPRIVQISSETVR